ncbi:(deoxy)nucleoside triphosphate pyrophosphohydrolase [Marispirochaeta sp.]|jgi:8-oxo-dGTP diphosphatase|uniref:(deoxy)nucleoside triphosphate pyrophosphohydrolase n=1 Tax=Marispirochaeta sp. TaxID=2038653 RepID=UPI0029C8FA57|nr:(deoxy)nucleoside triphosphate pyrophosphohydrolase [Marispirochaeta sp.]
MKRIRVTAAVVRRNGYILLARRSASQSRALMWEFPGGKVEEGENDRGCLVRELREELGIETRIGELVGVFPCTYPDISIELAVYNAEVLEGEPHPREHHELAWVTIDNLLEYKLADADVPAAELLYTETRK